MRWPIVFCLLIRSFLIAADFDCAVIGTSPIPLFEALYRNACGQRVLILEAEPLCGGAWKSIDICGLQHVDMGCHEISSCPELNQFLEEYAGCHILSAPNHTYYFSQGCFELIDHLLKRIAAEGIVLMTNCKVESATFDSATLTAALHTTNGTFTVSKIIVSPGCSFSTNLSRPQQSMATHKFYHLYLLIQDPTPPRFSYHGGVSPGVSRCMNLTSCVGLENSGRQLIVLQTHSDRQFENQQSLLDGLKMEKLIDPSAYLLQSDTYIYEQGPRFQIESLLPNEKPFFEMLNTSHFNRILQYAAKWKTALKPYKELQINY